MRAGDRSISPLLLVALVLALHGMTSCGESPAPGSPTPPPPTVPAPALPPSPAPAPPVVVPEVTEVADGVSTTSDGRILVELRSEDTSPANLFDLDGKTLVFTPDGNGSYSRGVRPVAWEEDIGQRVGDRAEIRLSSFMFDFAGRYRDSFHVSKHGLLTFGAPLAYNPEDSPNRFNTMREIAGKFVEGPTISPLFKTHFGGTWTGDDPLASQHVAQHDDRVTVTWFAAEPDGFYPGGIRPSTPDNRYQVVLHADGRIEFNYQQVTVGDGIVGLFPLDDDFVRGDLIANLAARRDLALPGHLDLLDAALYESNINAVILEFTLRAPIPDPGVGERYSYRLHFDTDKPYWDHPLDWSDEDATWQIDVTEGGDYTARGKGVRQFLSGEGETRISLLADASVLDTGGRGISAMAVAGAAHFRGDQWVQGDYDSRALLEFSAPVPRKVDLSASDSFSQRTHSETFHHRSAPDTQEIACRVVEILGDNFDLFVFNNEFRIDSQETGTPWSAVRKCSRRLRGHYALPDWLPGYHEEYLDTKLALLAHEFMHTWAAYLSYEKQGTAETLSDTNCRCHWRVGLHTPAAFPWRGGDAMSIMADWGGGFWRDNGDGTFTPVSRYNEGGPSWLDLYVMGLASASEVPDMFLLRNLKQVGGGRWTGDKEIITIEQIVAAEGPRDPPPSRSQKVFNAGFVYLLELGQTPSPYLLQLHRDYRDLAIEYWSHVTGGRSEITTVVLGKASTGLRR